MIIRPLLYAKPFGKGAIVLTLMLLLPVAWAKTDKNKPAVRPALPVLENHVSDHTNDALTLALQKKQWATIQKQLEKQLESSLKGDSNPLPPRLATQLLLAQAYQRQGMYSQALQVLEAGWASSNTLPSEKARLMAAWVQLALQQQQQLLPLSKQALQGSVYNGRLNNRQILDTLKASAQNTDNPAIKNNPLVLCAWGDWHLTVGDFDSAFDTYNRALQVNSRTLEAYYGLARYFLFKNSPTEAQTVLDLVLKLNPQDGQAYFLRAQAFALLKQPEQALAEAQKAEMLDKDVVPARDAFIAEQANALNSLSLSRQYAERYANSCTQSFAQTPNQAICAQAWLRLAQLNAQSKLSPLDTQTIQKAYQKTLSLDSGALEPELNLAWQALRQNDFKTAHNQASRLLGLLKGLPENLVSSAQKQVSSLLVLADWQEAQQPLQALELDALLKQLETDRQQVTATSSVSPWEATKLALLTQRLTEKRSTLNPVTAADQKTPKKSSNPSNNLPSNLPADLKAQLKAMAEDPDNKDNFVSGEAWFLLGDWPKAHEQLDALDGITAQGYLNIATRLSILPALEMAQIMAQRGTELNQQDQLTQHALQSLLKQLEQRRRRATQLLDQGNELFKHKQTKQALVLYQSAETLYPENLSTQLRLAETYQALNQDALAFEAYQKAVRLQPSMMDSKGFGKKYAKLAKKYAD